MSYLASELAARELVDILRFEDGTPVTMETWPRRRKELLEILSENSYGFTPPPPAEVRASVVSHGSPNLFGGKATQKRVRLAFDTPRGEFAFPVNVFVPKAVKSPPCFLLVNFRPDLPDLYAPIEEIIDNSFALAVFCYQDVVRDSLDGNFDQGLTGMFREPGVPRRANEWGKIGAWAYACSRVMDYLVSADEVDASRVAVVGHSRLGKTALWAAAQDERFFMGISNCSGFGGAAIHKKGTGERVYMFLEAGSWDWFCENFKSYLGREDENAVYDQHMLLACVFPRHIAVGSAANDDGADPKSEFLNCWAQNELYAMKGLRGLVTPDEYPAPGTALEDGRIGYHIREGEHFFSRTDWLAYFSYFKKVL